MAKSIIKRKLKSYRTTCTMNVNKLPSTVAGNRQLGAEAFASCYYDHIHYRLTVVRKSVGYTFQIMLTPYFNHWALFIMLRWQTASNDRHLVHNVKEWDNFDRLGIENCGQTFQLTVLINSNISMIAELNKLYLSPLARKASQTAFKWLFCTMCRLYVSSLRFINLRKNRTAPASKK